MGRRIELPRLPEGETQEQLQELYSYLYQMADALNNNLAEIGNGNYTDEEMKVVREIVGTDETNPGMPEAESLKTLIIKTAQLIKTEIDAYNLKLIGTYEAEGKLGRYVRKTRLDVDVTPSGITQNYTFQDIIQGLKTYEVNAKNYIKTGYLRTENNIPIYGVAIGKDIVTFANDGTETYHDGNKVAELTADELSFWQGGVKVAAYTGTKISFYSGNTEVMYIQGGKIYCNGDLEIETGKTFKIVSGGVMDVDTNNFKLDSANRKMVSNNMTFDQNGIIYNLGSSKKFVIGNYSAKDSNTNAGVFCDATTSNGSIRLLTSPANSSKETELVLETLINQYGASDLARLKFGGTWTVPVFGDKGRPVVFLMGQHYIGRDTVGSSPGNELLLCVDPNFDPDKRGQSGYPLWPQKYVVVRYDTNSAELWIYGTSPIHFTNQETYFQRKVHMEGILDVATIMANIVQYTYLVQNSSKDVKHDIRDMESIGEKLDRLRPVTFVYDNDPEERTRAGLIYEETQQVMPEICTGDEGNKAISYMEMVPMLLKEIQELRARVKALEERGGE